jgi:hypothetical protein
MVGPRRTGDATMKVLHPIRTRVEAIEMGRYYALAWGGTLDELVTTRSHETREAALGELLGRLMQLGHPLEVA